MLRVLINLFFLKMEKSQDDIKEEIRVHLRKDFGDQEMLELENYLKNGEKEKISTLIKNELGNKTLRQVSDLIEKLKIKEGNDDRLRAMNEILDAVR